MGDVVGVLQHNMVRMTEREASKGGFPSCLRIVVARPLGIIFSPWHYFVHVNPILGAPLHYQARRCITRRAAALPVAQWGALGLDRGSSSTKASRPRSELDQGVRSRVKHDTPRARHTSSATHLERDTPRTRCARDLSPTPR